MESELGQMCRAWRTKAALGLDLEGRRLSSSGDKVNRHRQAKEGHHMKGIMEGSDCDTCSGREGK